MREKKKVVLAAIGLLVLITALLTIWFFTRPDTVQGSKTVTVQVVHGDERTKEILLETDAVYLGQALMEKEGLIEGEDGPYGLYIRAVDGEHDDERRQTWWCITKDGESLSTSVDTTPIAHGDRFELTLKTGY